METVMKEYREHIGQTIKVHIYYEIGDHGGYRPQERGYYLSVSPVTVTDLGGGVRSESYMGFTGYKTLLLPVKRKSQKREQEAIDLSYHRIDNMIERVLSEVVS